MMKTFKKNLWKHGAPESFLAVRLEESEMMPRPAMLVIPGGGYHVVCEDREGAPIAAAFEALGFRSFVLNYRCAPNRFPTPQLDAIRAIKLIRANASEWGVMPDQIAVCGFSAGGHLASTCAYLADELDAQAADGDAADAVSGRPNGVVLAYAVLSATGEWMHRGTYANLLGGLDDAAMLKHLSFDQRVTAKTPSAFIWHTRTDSVVDYRNSVVSAEAMWRAGRPCHLSIFPTGNHGLCLGFDAGAKREDVAFWPAQVKAFFRLEAGFRFEDRPLVRKAFRMKVNPGCHAEYRRRHNPIWPELQEALLAAGTHSYSIYLDEETNTLFGYAEIESEARWNAVASTPVNQKWWAHMVDVMPANPDNSPVSKKLSDVFHIE